MSWDEVRFSTTAATMREVFDQSFAGAPATAAARPHDYLAFRAGGDPYAIRLADVAALHRDRKIVRLPNRSPELIGIAGFRGMMAPVYDLGALLGYPRTSKATWLVIARGKAPVGLAFEQFEAHVRVPEENVSPEDREKTARLHVRGVVRAHHVLRPLIHVASIFEAIARRAHADGPPKEA